MWNYITFLLFLFYYTSNGQIIQASIAEQRVKLLSGKKTLSNGKQLLALHAEKPVIDYTGTSKSAQRWPNGQVNYYIDQRSYDQTIAGKLKAVFGTLASYDACPEFNLLKKKPVGNSGSWLHFTNPNRIRPCVHEPGGTGSPEEGEVVVVLGYDCLKPHELLHTVMHGLGFHDEVTHPQRDLFVKVIWDDIQPAFRSMFQLRSMQQQEPGKLLDYDPKSIMHFHDHAYSLTGNPSLAPLLPGLTIEPSKELSHIDKMKLRLLFTHECKKRQINKILDSCTKSSNGNNIDGNNNGGDTGDGKLIVVPGNDVTNVMPDYHSDDGADSGDSKNVDVPGSDVVSTEADAKGDNDDAENAALSDDGGKIVVPGNDISIIDEIDSKEAVVEGNDEVKTAEVTDENPGSQNIDSNDNRSGGMQTLKGDNSQVTLEEGNDTEEDQK